MMNSNGEGNVLNMGCAWRGHDLSQATDRSSNASTYSASYAFQETELTSHVVCMNMPATTIDTESNVHCLSGYPSLANFIASDRDRTTLIYRRFDELAARNLLYLQSELAELQAKQHAYDQEDLSADLATKQCARNFTDFKRAQEASDTRQKERWKLMKQIRETLKEYREALLFESTLATLPRPSKGVLRAFQKEYYNEKDKKSEPFPTLGGSSAGIYDDIDDLVALRVQDDQDRLTNFAQEHLAFLFPVSSGSTKLQR
jgi:hypothetical protein